MTKFDTPETREAFVLVTMERAHFKLLLGEADETKEAMDKCEKILDMLDSVDLAVHASFYRVSGDYWKVSLTIFFSNPSSWSSRTEFPLRLSTRHSHFDHTDADDVLCAILLQAKAEFADYYKNSLLYLACINLEKDLTAEERTSRAHDLGISALLGTIYNFGELVRLSFLYSYFEER